MFSLITYNFCLIHPNPLLHHVRLNTYDKSNAEIFKYSRSQVS